MYNARTRKYTRQPAELRESKAFGIVRPAGRATITIMRVTIDWGDLRQKIRADKEPRETLHNTNRQAARATLRKRYGQGVLRYLYTTRINGVVEVDALYILKKF